MSKAKLDIIATFDKSIPWSALDRFMNIIDYQQCIDKDDVVVTLVYDENIPGKQIAERVENRSFYVNTIPIPFKSTAHARNIAIANTHAEWMMFCNVRDMFTDVCSLDQILQVLPTTDANIIWMEYCKEKTLSKGKTFFVNLAKELMPISTEAKMYRRLFLYDHAIRFNEDLPEYSDAIFNMLVLTETEHFMIKQLTTDIYPYFITFKPYPMHYYKDLISLRFARENILCNEYKKRKKHHEYLNSIVRIFADAYHVLYSPDQENKPELSPEFIEFYKNHRKTLDTFSKAELEIILSGSETECLSIAQDVYGELRGEMYFANDDLTFDEWLRKLDDLYINNKPISADNIRSINSAPVQEIMPVVNAPVISEKPGRVVVYCGTYNVYTEMMASAKSLLCNTQVDKVYFLTEDDKFPYDIPDIIENINVKNQKYFPPDGPNFNNAWTYMCMIRTAFPEMFSQYDKVLSLDIDIIVNDDISDLWDYDMTDYYIAGVPENNRQKKSTDPLYVNFGVVMMNLKKLREDNIQQGMIETLNKNKTDCPEQGVYNRYCAGHILPLPNDYNVTLFSHITGEPLKERILHYAGQKYWKHYSNVKKYSNLSWNEVMERQAKLHG